MDELDLLARALPDARPPSPEVVARARARLTGPPVRPVRRRAWTWAAAAAVVVTAVIVTMVFSLVAYLTPTPVAVAPRANQALFDLADRIERLPEESGVYWRQVSINGNYQKADGLTYLASTRLESWQSRDPADPMLMVFWSEPIARPATAADERAWRAAGSPRRIKLLCEDGERCPSVSVTDKLGKCVYRQDAAAGGVLPDRTVGTWTMADLAAFPTDQDGLREKLRAYHKVWYKRGFKEPFEKFLPVTANLLNLPLRPNQRAALIRLLAGVPSTKVVGTVTDPLGRPALSVDFGVAGHSLVYDSKKGKELPVYSRTLLDPGTGKVLADVSYAARTAVWADKGDPMTFTATAPESGWTTARPAPPKGCEKRR